MATNKKKIFVTESMSQLGRALLKERDDIELVEFPNMISAPDFEAMLKAQAPVHGVALGATRFGEPELDASKDMKVVTRIGVGFDAVDVPALSRRKVPLMVAGTANSPSVAEQALFMMLTLAKRAVEMHAIVKDGRWGHRLGMLPYDLFGKTVLIIGFGRIGTRTAKRCLAMEMNVLVYDPYKPVAEIKTAIHAQQKFLGELVEQSSLWELEGAELRIYFPPDKRPFAEMMEGRETLEKIRSISSKVLGRAVRVCAKLEGVAAAAASAARGTQELRAQFERDPMVRSMLQRFGGKISEVKRNQEES